MEMEMYFSLPAFLAYTHMAGMGKRSGKTLRKKGTSANSIKRFLAAEPEDFLDSDGLGRSPHGSGAGSAPWHRPDTRHLSPVSSSSSDGKGSPVRRLGTVGAATLPTTADLASVLLGLERTIKKDVSDVRTNLAQVLEHVESPSHRFSNDLQSFNQDLIIQTIQNVHFSIW